MFTTITITTSTDEQGNQYTSIRRYDNHGKLDYTGKHAGDGRVYRTGNTHRITSAIRGMGFHFMHRTYTGMTFGKLIA